MARPWFGYACLVLVVAAFTAQSELSQSLQRAHDYNHPYVIVWLNHVFLILLFPPVLIYLYTTKPRGSAGAFLGDGGKGAGGGGGFAGRDALRPTSPTGSLNGDDSFTETDSLISYPPRVSGDKDIYSSLHLRYARAQPKWTLAGYLLEHGYSWGRYWWTGIWVCFLYLAPNYAWYIGLPMKGVTVAEANAVFNSSCIYVYLLSIVMLGEKWNIAKGFTVVLALGGVTCIALKDSSSRHFSMSWGIVIIFVASIAIGFYEVAYTKWVVKRGSLPLPIVLLLVAQNGLSHLLFFWFVIPILNVIGFERFEWPDPVQAYYLCGNATLAFLGNLGLMTALAIFPTPLVVSVALLLIIPASGVIDTVLHGACFTPLSYAGAGLIILAFLILAFLEHRDHRRKANLPILV